MTPVVATITRLLTQTPLTALVGTRIVNQQLGQNPTLPCVVAFEVDAIGGQFMRGPDGFTRARIQTECRSQSKTQADDVAAALHGDGLGSDASGLFGWTGSVGGSPEVIITNVQDVGRRSGYDPEELRQYFVQRDYLISFRGIV